MTKPVLNYRCRTDAVVALRAKGLPAEEVARLIGATRKNVESLERYGRRRGQALHVEAIATVLPDEVQERLAPQARKRNLSLNRLIIRILTAVANDNIVDAVLDDEGGSA